jgi:hypothetical protein
MKWLSSALRDPVLLGNLLLRIALVTWVVSHQHYTLSDSLYYLESAGRVCHGEWGGDSYRMPFYFWYLCGLSFGGVGLALVVQTLIVWGVGVFLTRRFGRAIGAIWLFDPVLLVYSNLVMTDALFAVAMFGLSVGVRKLLFENRPSLQLSAITGAAMALVILIRPIGMPLFAATLAFLVLQALRKRIALSRILLLSVVTALLLMPRLYWNGTHHHGWRLSNQGGDISNMFAGIATYTNQGLDFTQAQERWGREHPNSTLLEDYRALAQNSSQVAWLVSKSVLRVLVGHVNVEGFYLLSGRHLIGPGWFKNLDTGQQDQRVQGFGQYVWIAAVTATALLCVAFYFWMVRELWVRRSWNSYVAWSVLAMAVLTISPVVVGDARFRLPVLAVALALVGFSRSGSTPTEQRAV